MMTKPKDAIAQALREVVRKLPEPARSYYWSDRRRLAHDAELALAHGATFLDVGSGYSPLAAILSVLGMKSTMLDRFDYPVDERFAMNRDQINQVLDGFQVRRIRADIEQGIPLADDSISVISCLAVIEHVHHNPLKLLKEIDRVLKPRGRVIISAPNAVNLRKRISVLFGRTNLPSMRSFCQGDKWYGHVHEPTRYELEWLMRKAEFAETRVFGRNFIATQNYGVAGKVLGLLLPTGMRSELYAVARSNRLMSRKDRDPVSRTASVELDKPGVVPVGAVGK